MCPALLLNLVAWIALGQQDSATPRPETKSSPASSKALQDFKRDASDYVMRLENRPNDELTLRNEPLLHWGNPARYGEDGAVFVWMLDGRPEVVGSVFTFRQGNLIRRKHEYHSLAGGPLSAEYRGQRVWTPRTAGVAFQAIADAPKPDDAPRRRLSQMKTLAADFSANMVEFNGQRSELRLLPQPLLRYEPQRQAIVDGALFAFSLGTDPEVLLLLEARGEPERAEWQFAFARFHFMELKGSYKQREVWRVEGDRGIPGLSIGSPKYQDSVYATYQVSASPAQE